MVEATVATTLIPAVLETSFWIAAYRAEVAANLFDFSQTVVPLAVEGEILARPIDQLRGEYPYATLFRQFRPRMTDPPAKAPPSLTSFGPGEAAAIPLAGSLAAVLLINERRASEYARRDGTQVITVPAFIVALRGQEIIGDRAARRKLTLIAPITAPDFIAEAFELLDQIP